MRAVRDVIPATVMALLRDQPHSEGKVEFAWRVAAGPALARATTLRLDAKGTLHVGAEDPHWRREVARAMPVLRMRLADLLGTTDVKRVVSERPARRTENDASRPARRPGRAAVAKGSRPKAGE